MLGLLFVGLNVNGEEFVLDEAVLEEIGIDNLNLEDNTLMSRASIHPQRTDLVGSSAWANWDLSWSNATAPFKIHFNHGNGYTAIIDPRTNSLGMKHSYEYNLSYNENHKTYNVTLTVIDNNDNWQTASGVVYQNRR